MSETESSMSQEWGGGGPNLAAARSKRAERERSELVKTTIIQLGAIASVKPEYAPVAKIALDVVKAAQERVEALEDRVAIAEERARLAEELVANVKPHLDEITEQRDAIASQLAAQREVADAERAEKAAAVKRADVAKSIGQMAAGIAEIARAQADLPRSPELEILSVIHRHVIDDEGRSAVACMTEVGEWRVVDEHGDTVEEFGSRRAAIKFVREAYDAQKAAESHDDALDSPRASRRKKQPGAEPVDRLPEPPAAISSDASKRRRSPRIL